MKPKQYFCRISIFIITSNILKDEWELKEAYRTQRVDAINKNYHKIVKRLTLPLIERITSKLISNGFATENKEFIRTRDKFDRPREFLDLIIKSKIEHIDIFLQIFQLHSNVIGIFKNILIFFLSLTKTPILYFKYMSCRIVKPHLLHLMIYMTLLNQTMKSHI